MEERDSRIVGDISNPYQQNYSDTCAIKSQQLILNDFGIPVSEDQCVQYSIEHGWYSNDGSGTRMGDIGKLLNDAGVPCSQTNGANVYDLVNELAQGHKIIVGVDSGELWDNTIWDWLKELFYGDTPDHALIVAGIDMTDPDNPMIVVTDPGKGHAAHSYPLDRFMDAWSDSNYFMVSTNVATPEAAQSMVLNGLVDGHLNEIANVDYNIFSQFHDYSHQIDFTTQGPQLYNIFQQFPSMEMSFNDALSQFNLPPFDPVLTLSLPTTNYIDPFSFNYLAIRNLDWVSPTGGILPVTDVLSDALLANPTSVYYTSGLPTDDFSYLSTDEMSEQNQTNQHQNYTLESNSVLVEDKAMDNDSYEEPQKWENVSNPQQQEMHNLWDTPNYDEPSAIDLDAND